MEEAEDGQPRGQPPEAAMAVLCHHLIHVLQSFLCVPRHPGVSQQPIAPWGQGEVTQLLASGPETGDSDHRIPQPGHQQGHQQSHQQNIGKKEAKNFSSVCKYFIKIEILTLQVAFHDKLF